MSAKTVASTQKFWSVLLYISAAIFTVMLYFWMSRKYSPEAETVIDSTDGKSCSSNEGQLILLSDNNESSIDAPFCIDGSSPGYYIRKGYGEGKSKWVLHFEGGGWCYDLEACYLRSKTVLGSSREYANCVGPKTLKFYLSSVLNENPMMYNWNTVLVKYCDGSSYAGNSIQNFEGKKLYFKGKNNRDATIRSLLSKGMEKASHIVITGCSAGGLGIYLGIDQMAEIIRQSNPLAIVRGLSDSGFFLDYTSDYRSPETHLPHGKDEASINGLVDYSQAMKNVFQFTNMSAGAHPQCVKSMEEKNHVENCVFAENLVGFIKTPLFALQPQYDQWQILHVIGRNFNESVVNSFGARIVGLLHSRLLLPSSSHGAFVDSCGHHCTSCSVKTENVWAGAHIYSTYHSKKTNPANAFSTWFSHSLVSSGSNDWSRRFFFQNHSFPCESCCLCFVYH